MKVSQRLTAALLCLLLVFAFLPCAPAEMQETAAADSASAAVTPPIRTDILLRSGSSGAEVSALQLRLIELGYDPGPADGIFGSATKTAVISFQKRNKLDADGLAGPATLKVLFSDEALPAPEAAPPVDVLAGEFPMLVNKEYPVPEDFMPADLVLMTDYCDSSLVRIKYEDTRGVRTAVEALVRMLEAAREDGVTHWQVSAGFRSFADQDSLLNNKINSYRNKHITWSRARARSAALKTVAEPGASEHHLGLAFDVNVPGTSSFAGTAQCKWLHKHCWDYGFVIRYQKNKESITGFSAEAWHIRYVGTEHSLIMRDLDLCLEEYLEQLQEGEIIHEVLD